MGRPAGRELTRNERARLAKLHRLANAARYASDGELHRAELRAEALRLWHAGASLRVIADAIGVAKSRAGQLVAEARTRQETAA